MNARGRRRRAGWAGAAACIALLVCTGDAWAFCREVSASPPANFDPVNDGCFTGSSTTLFWRNQCTSYSLQRGASKQFSLSQAQAVAGAAFAAWTSASCPTGGTPSIVVDPFAPVSCDQAPSQEHNNPIIFRDNGWPYSDQSNAIGYTTLTVNLDTGEILGAAIEINTSAYTIVADGGAPPQGSYDLLSILTHEAGHFLGLAHSQSTSAIMYAFYQAGSNSLTADDVLGICSIYSPDGSRSTSAGPFAAVTCDPNPPGGFLDDCGPFDAGITSVGSGATPNAASLPAMPCPTSPSCSVGRTAPIAELGAPASGALIALALLGRRMSRRRSRSQRRSGQGGALAVSVGLLLGSGIASPRTASASVSIAVRWNELLEKASAVAVVTPVALRSEWDEGRIVTHTTVRVERLIAGSLPGEATIRTRGGAVGRIGQLVEGQATFELGQTSLVFVRPVAGEGANAAPDYAVVEGAQGQFPILAAPGTAPRLGSSANVGALIAPAEDPARGSSHAQGALAREVLLGMTVDQAAGALAGEWRRLHPERDAG